MRPAPTTRMRSAPRCTAGEIGAAWRIEPSPQYSVWPSMSSATAGKTNGIADDASRCGTVIAARTAMPLRARPRHDVVERVVEGDVQARAVARRGDGERVQMALAHHPRAGARCRPARRAARRAASCRAASAAARGASARSPSRSTSSSASARRCGSRRANRRGRPARRGSSPRRRPARRRAVEVVGAAGERRGVDRAGRGAGDDRERDCRSTAPLLAADLRDRLQHADLVGGARAAAGEHQPGRRRAARIGMARASRRAGAVAIGAGPQRRRAARSVVAAAVAVAAFCLSGLPR